MKNILLGNPTLNYYNHCPIYILAVIHYANVHNLFNVFLLYCILYILHIIKSIWKYIFVFYNYGIGPKKIPLIPDSGAWKSVLKYRGLDNYGSRRSFKKYKGPMRMEIWNGEHMEWVNYDIQWKKCMKITPVMKQDEVEKRMISWIRIGVHSKE